MSNSIELALITSVTDTPTLSQLGDIDLAFAHLCQTDEAYLNYFQRSASRGRTVILDNAIMELGHSYDEKCLLDVTRRVRPAYLTPPEVLGDGYQSVELARDFIAREPDLQLPEVTRILGVVHGQSWPEWLACYQVFHEDLDAVSLIGIPYDLTFDIPGVRYGDSDTLFQKMIINRVAAVRLLDERGLNRKPAHLLGCVDAIELRAQASYPWIVSNDSSTAFVSALRGELYDPEHGIRARKQKIDMRSVLPEGRRALFSQNVAVIRGFARRPPPSSL